MKKYLPNSQKEVEKIKNQIDELAKVKQWKPVVFGNYMDKNGKAPLEWLVLDKCGDEITLVTKNIIDCHEFCENICTSWKDSDIREWLNGEFIDKAFNKNEQKFLVSKSIDSDYGEVDGGKFVTTKDKVYLLSSKDFSDKKQGKGLAKLFGKTAKDMLFNPEESLSFNGNTGPYLQYMGARINSILAKAQETGITPDDSDAAVALLTSEDEWALIKQLGDFPSAIQKSAENLDPSLVAAYVYETAKLFSKFYQTCSIVNAENKQLAGARLYLASCSLQVIKNAMNLVLVPYLERM